jgi:hypothetical protein
MLCAGVGCWAVHRPAAAAVVGWPGVHCMVAAMGSLVLHRGTSAAAMGYPAVHCTAAGVGCTAVLSRAAGGGCLAVLALGCVFGLAALGCWVWTWPVAAQLYDGMQYIHVHDVNTSVKVLADGSSK